MRGLPSVVLGVCILVTVAGCGGGAPEALVGDTGVQDPQGSGSLHFAVRFPPRDEVAPEALPVATNSVGITVHTLSPYALVGSACIQRPDPNGGGGDVTLPFRRCRWAQLA